jgi:hypothetical protein
MRIKEAHIPIVLWVSAAALLHLGGGEQADRVAAVHESEGKLRIAARTLASATTLTSVVITPGNLQTPATTRHLLHANAVYSDGTRIDISQQCSWSSSDREVVSVGTRSPLTFLPGYSLLTGEWPGQIIANKPGAAAISCTWEGTTGSVAVIVGELVEVDLKEEIPEDPKDEVTPDKKDPKKPEKKADEKQQPPQEIIAAEILPEEKEKPLDEKKEQAPEPPPPPPMPDEKKIAVQQHQDQDEKENPEANYLAEKNHKVKPGEETQASITSTSENDKNPTPGTHNGAGAPDQPGNGDKTVVAQDDNRPGAKVAPNVIPKGAAPNQPTTPNPEPPKKPGSEQGNDKAPTPSPKHPSPTPVATAQPKTESGAGITAPQPSPVPAAKESPTGDPALAVGPTSSAKPLASAVPPGAGDGKPKLPTLPSTPGGPKWVGSLGFGAKGDNGKPTISIDEKVAKAAIGMDQLDKLKKIEGETKLSMHRGQWKSSSLEKWRAAIENYVPGVKTGNQTNLGTAAAPWATYLAQIHVRLHPIFAEGFVDGLSDLPSGHPLQDKNLVTRMEIVIKSDGTIHHLGIVKASGVTAFDIAALDSVDRAGPFGKVPTEIISPDGLAYLHWEFHRDEMRCSNVNAYPYKLKEGGAPPPDPKAPPPPPNKPPEGAPKLPSGSTMGALKSPNG